MSKSNSVGTKLIVSDVEVGGLTRKGRTAVTFLKYL